MAEPNESQVILPAGFQVGSTIVLPRADEQAFPLRLDEFQILCDGTNGNDRAGRELCLGLFFSALLSAVSMYLAIDWSNFWTQRRWGVLVCFAVPVLLAVGSLVGVVFYVARMWNKDNPYSRLKKGIHNHFLQQGTNSAPEGESASGTGS